MKDDEIVMQPAYTSSDHNHAYRVRNMLEAAGLQAEVCPAHQIVTLPHYTEFWVEAPWYVMVPDAELARATDLAERWRIRFEESDGG